MIRLRSRFPRRKAVAMSKTRPGVLSLIGNTPVVEIRRIHNDPRVRILAKLESRNPGGSVKDRVALYMIEGAENRGELRPGMTVLEATSGNTGIGLAMVCAVKGYRITLVMSEGVSVERRRILRALGADIILTPAEKGTDAAIEKVYAMAREDPHRFYVPDQFNNPDNWRAHYLGTANEIWRDTGGKITHVVAAMGTTGTLMGLSRRLKELNPMVEVVAVEPMPGHKIQGLKNLKESYVPGIFEKDRLDQKVNVEDEEAFEMTRRLAREEGIFVGMSSGAAMVGALKLARKIKEGLIVVIFPDGGDRYLSTSVFVPREIPTFCFYNTMTRRKENFEPLEEGRVRIYSCGPTVDGNLTLEFWRRAIVADLLKRYLMYKGFRVTHVMNITDLDDRTIKGAQRQGLSLREFTEANIRSFMEEMEFLRIRLADHYPRASDHIEDMIKMGLVLEGKGIAYPKHGSLYFDISKFPRYGKLSRVDLRKIKIGLTVDLDDYEKDNPRDFTLFKRSTLAELREGITYSSPWGQVRPSWHMECAAMVMKLMGETIDIHTSNRSLIFPHHENEIAICEAITGKPLARYWLHCEGVLVEGGLARKDQSVTLKDLIRMGFGGREVRYLLLSTHYRKPLRFSLQALVSARRTLERMDRLLMRLRGSEPLDGVSQDPSDLIAEAREGFERAMDDDLNISMALANVFRLSKGLNVLLDGGKLSREGADKALQFLEQINNILDCLDMRIEEPLDEELMGLIKKREEARAQRLWEEADRIREKLSTMGIQLIDTPSGTRWVRRSDQPL